MSSIFSLSKGRLWKSFAYKFKLLLVFLIAPVVSFLLLSNSLSEIERFWNDMLQQSVSAERVPELVLSRACTNVALRQAVDINSVCSAYSNIHTLQRLAFGLGIIPLLLVISLMIAGAVCRSNRDRLRVLFRPGFVVCNLTIVALLLSQGLLLSGTILYTSSKGATDDSFYFYSALFGMIALTGAYFTLKPLFSRKRASASVIGKSVHAVEYPQLWRFVKGLADRTGTECPQNVVLGLTPNFFVTEADVFCIGKTLTGRTMYLSLPLCRVLCPQELSAVIAHELAHFKGEDTRFSLDFYPIYRSTVAAISDVSETAGKIANLGRFIPIRGVGLLAVLGSLTLFPSIFMLRFFLECFSAAENAISRDREIAADSFAATTVDPTSTASALVKIHAFAGLWADLNSILRDALLAGYVQMDGEERSTQFFANLCDVFVMMAETRIDDQTAFDGLEVATLPHPTDSHPPLHVRLAALGTNLSQVRRNASTISLDAPSSEVVDNYQMLELELSAVERLIVGPAQASGKETGLAA
jgi:Zn-dependent protease with chaperone function